MEPRYTRDEIKDAVTHILSVGAVGIGTAMREALVGRILIRLEFQRKQYGATAD